jgi:hypothetical protein
MAAGRGEEVLIVITDHGVKALNTDQKLKSRVPKALAITFIALRS